MPRKRLTANTLIYINNVNGNDSNDGSDRNCAYRTPQFAYTDAFNNTHANNKQLTFVYCNTGVPYPGTIFTYQMPGLPHDFGINVTGELNAGGGVSVLIDDSAAGCLHVAGNCQVYASNLGFQSHGNTPNVVAAFGGFLGLNNVVFYGSDTAPCVQAGRRGGNVDFNGPWYIHGGDPRPFHGSAAINAVDRSSVYIPSHAPCTFYGTPRFSTGLLCVSDAGCIETRNGWAGNAICPKFYRQAPGYFLPTDPVCPGDQPGVG